jgi:hypothetical protein
MKLSHSSHSPWKSPKSGDYHIPTARRLRTILLCSNRDLLPFGLAASGDYIGIDHCASSGVGLDVGDRGYMEQFFFRLDVYQNLCHPRDRTKDGILHLVSDLVSATHR